MTDERRDYFAARVRDTGDEERLVVVLAADDHDARRESGLIDADFHPAHDDELDEWETETLRPLTEDDVRTCIRLVRREQVAISNRLARQRGLDQAGIAGEDPRTAHRDRRVRYKARKLAQLRGKLELMLGDPDEADDGEPFIEEPA